MSTFNQSLCHKCLNVNDGTNDLRLKVCYNELGQIASAKDLVTGADFTTAATLTAIETWIITGTAPAGFTITERTSCSVDFKYPDYQACFADASGNLVVSGSFTEKQDAELGTTASVTQFTVLTTNDATNLPEGDSFTELAGDVVYTSGSFAGKDLSITVNGVALTQADCIPCASC